MKKSSPTRLLRTTRNEDFVLLQDIDSFTKVSETSTVLAFKDLTFSAASTPTPRDPDPNSDLVTPSPAFEVNVDRVSVWLPNACSYILAALASNVSELCQSIARRSSEFDIIKPSQVRPPPSWTPTQTDMLTLSGATLSQSQRPGEYIGSTFPGSRSKQYQCNRMVKRVQ